jgi:hypothetical protein
VRLTGGEIRRYRLVEKLAVAGALEEVDPRNHRIPQERVHGEEQRTLHDAVDEEPMRVRVDVGHAAVVPLEVQPAGRDHPLERLQRRA